MTTIVDALKEFGFVRVDARGRAVERRPSDETYDHLQFPPPEYVKEHGIDAVVHAEISPRSLRRPVRVELGISAHDHSVPSYWRRWGSSAFVDPSFDILSSGVRTAMRERDIAAATEALRWWGGRNTRPGTEDAPPGLVQAFRNLQAGAVEVFIDWMYDHGVPF